MTTALDDIAFLANSENRVAVLRTLAEAPASHDEIRDRIGASRVTTARILREFEDREWITRSGQECTITPAGEWVCDEFTRLLDEIAAERRLRKPLQWLPSDLLTFDVRRLRDAEVVVLEESDATAIIRRILEYRRSSDRIRGVTRMVAPVFIENDWESTVHGDTRLEQVITPGVLDTIRNHSTAAKQLREMLDETDVHVSVYADIPISVGIYDAAVGIDLTDEEGVVKAGLVTEDETVREWAVDLFERCRDEARPVDPDEITADH
ncbi:helix-turn-helix transcriptional regulator [Natronorubrum sp. FCH18a]|uniref:helix-turn-helix transcriptional regulator n=1 Tax=Natronorubrum sp. FCH18a TaxID=3447018 RepID=UPI003F50F686